jgi:hypothetical protein
MLTKIKLGLGVVGMAMVLVGCGGQVNGGDVVSAEQDIQSAKEDALCKSSHPSFYKCDTDADCVAVEQAGCCPNGYQVAVNATKVDAYQTTFACTEKRICPLYVVNDTRVAQCDFAKHQCQMIQPTDIHCGGFIAPARQHQCPTGFTCQLDKVPDVGGSCVATPAQQTN